MSILEKIKEANLLGRGGAAFPVALKWEAVYQALRRPEGEYCHVEDDQVICHRKIKVPRGFLRKGYVVVNAAEGEPGIRKDGYILANYPTKVIDGIRLALEYTKAEKAYIYINHLYFDESGKRLNSIIKKMSLKDKIALFVKPVDGGYIAGEESSILNIIEGRRAEPRLKPPYPTQSGLWGQPTLVNNVETFYNVSLVSEGKYLGDRFYTINGQVKHRGVYVLSENLTITEVLKQTNNFPDFKFFVVVGGDVSGEVLYMNQLNKVVSGAGSITVFDMKTHSPEKLLSYWFKFYANHSCGQCTPCREGAYRLKEILESNKKLDYKNFAPLLDNLSASSFCALGSSLPQPVKTYFKNVWPKR